MSTLFTVPENLPKRGKRIATFRTTELNTLSPSDPDVERYYSDRIKRYRKAFNLTRKPKDAGDRLLFRERAAELEVYKASDSFWWTDTTLAFRETLKRGAKLPEDDAAIEMATAHLKKIGADLEHAKLHSVSHTEVCRDDAKGDKTSRRKTAVNVNFAFEMEGIPVVGSGAKIQVSLSGQEQVAQVILFWRTTRQEEGRITQVISPTEALERFTKDPRFMRLDERSSSVKIHEVELGYFALPPFEFQRFLIPVYTVTGTVKTEHLERYDFTAHVVAADLSADEVKKNGIVADPASCRVF